MKVGIAEKVFKVRGQGHLMIVCELYCYNSYLYSLEGTIKIISRKALSRRRLLYFTVIVLSVSLLFVGVIKAMC